MKFKKAKVKGILFRGVIEMSNEHKKKTYLSNPTQLQRSQPPPLSRISIPYQKTEAAENKSEKSKHFTLQF